MTYTIAWAKAFALTATVEILVVALLFRAGVLLPAKDGEGAAAAPVTSAPDRRAALLRLCAVAFFAQLVSHPSVWFIIPSLVPTYSVMVIVAEVWAVVSEALFYALVVPGVPLRTAAGASLVANGCSFGLGLALRSLTGWV